MAKVKQPKPALYYLILSVTLVLLFIGMVMIASASSVVAYLGHKDSFFFLWRQFAYIAAGMILLYLASRVDYRLLRKLSPVGLALSIVSLVLVFVPGVGQVAGGAQRWIGVGELSFQPSELAKLAFILYTADILTRKKWKNESLIGLAKPLGIPLLIISALILAQPDLGTLLIILISVFALLFLSGIRFRELIPLGVGGSAAVFASIWVEPYRRKRWLAFLDPEADPLKNGFQYLQSLMAFGSGGLQGVGLGLSRQKFGYLPAPYTDFIFAIIGEELGLAGTLSVVFIFLVFSLLIWYAVRRCNDPFGRLIGGGIGAMILSQAVINMGAVTGMLPITGITLPLISYGGTSLVLTLASIGILLNLTLTTKKKRGVSRENNDMRRGDSRSRLPRTGAGRSA